MGGIGPPAIAASTCLMTTASDTAGVAAAGTAHMNGVHTRCVVVARHCPAAPPLTDTTSAHETATMMGSPFDMTRPCATTDTTVTPTAGVPEPNVREDVQILALALAHAMTDVSLTSLHDWAHFIMAIALVDGLAVAAGLVVGLVVGLGVGLAVAAAVGMVDGFAVVVAAGALAVAVACAGIVAGGGHWMAPFTHGHVTPSRSAGTHGDG